MVPIHVKSFEIRDLDILQSRGIILEHLPQLHEEIHLGGAFLPRGWNLLDPFDLRCAVGRVAGRLHVVTSFSLAIIYLLGGSSVVPSCSSKICRSLMSCPALNPAFMPSNTARMAACAACPTKTSSSIFALFFRFREMARLRKAVVFRKRARRSSATVKLRRRGRSTVILRKPKSWLLKILLTKRLLVWSRLGSTLV